MTGFELSAIGLIITAVAGAFAVIYKLKPDSDALVITQAQGAATILNSLVETLREEVQREREENVRLRQENVRLRKENEGLRRRRGTRAEDQPDE